MKKKTVLGYGYVVGRESLRDTLECYAIHGGIKFDKTRSRAIKLSKEDDGSKAKKRLFKVTFEVLEEIK